jgi:GGDEF domain-containing protein
MRLDYLYKRKSLLSEAEDTGQPLDPSRYPPIRRHQLAKYEPAIDVETEVEELKQMAFEYPPAWLTKENGGKGKVDPPDYKAAVVAYRRCQAAFRRLLQRLQLNPMSGLRGDSEYQRLSSVAQRSAAKRSKFGGRGPGEYIVIAADVDKMKYLNDKTGLGHAGVNAILQNVGKLFNEGFGNIQNTKMFHPHGDEFRVISYVGDMSPEKVQIQFAQLIQGCLTVANGLASTGFYLEGWEDVRRVQPTISFGISTTDTAADGILTHVKTGASTGKEIRYVVVVDRDLRYDLGLTPEQMNKHIQSLQQVSSQVEVFSVDPPDVAAYDAEGSGTQGSLLQGLTSESRMPMEDAMGKTGAICCEASWSEITPQRKRELELFQRQKRAYLDNPAGVVKEGRNYIPLKEAFKPSQ